MTEQKPTEAVLRVVDEIIPPHVFHNSDHWLKCRESVATLITAKEGLNYLAEQNQQQRALLVEACRLISNNIALDKTLGRIPSLAFTNFLSIPAVVELLKSQKPVN